jgi:predicted dehydrogenase
MSDTRDTRRTFIQQLGVGAAGVWAGGELARAHATAPSETLNVGCIGTGGRCRRLMERVAKIRGVRITAVCDIWDVHLEMGRKLADPKAKTFKDFHKLLDRSDVDAVVIGSPDHWHVPMTIAACQAGKDVYVEKPLTHDLSEGKAVIEAQNAHKRIVQVGTQQRSMPQIRQGYKIIKSGELGHIYKVHLTWNRNSARWARPKYGIDPKTLDWKAFLGNAPQQDFDEYRFRNWRWFWDFGGGICTDLMVHWMDVACWFLDLGNPAMAVAIGDQFKARNLWETPDTIQTLLRYPEQEVQVYFEGTFVNARNRAGIEFMGENGTLYLDRGRYEVHADPHKKIKERQLVLGKGPRGADFFQEVDGAAYHLQNWVECVRSRKRPWCTVEDGVRCAAPAHLANKAFRTGRTALWEA